MAIEQKKFMRYSENFGRDYYFYLSLIDRFDFCGREILEAEQSDNGKSAMECFYLYDTKGKLYPCKDSILFNKLIFAKAALNWQIKQWAEGISEGTSTYKEMEKYILDTCSYDVPNWVFNSLFNQSRKLIKQRLIKIME